jgi:hypothetical protein
MKILTRLQQRLFHHLLFNKKNWWTKSNDLNRFDIKGSPAAAFHPSLAYHHHYRRRQMVTRQEHSSQEVLEFAQRVHHLILASH